MSAVKKGVLNVSYRIFVRGRGRRVRRERHMVGWRQKVAYEQDVTCIVPGKKPMLVNMFHKESREVGSISPRTITRAWPPARLRRTCEINARRRS